MGRKGKAKRTDHQNKLLTYCIQNRCVLLFALLMLLGIVIGALIVRSAPQNLLENMGFLTSSFMDKRGDQNLALTFLHSLGASFSILVLLFVCGFCAVSMPVIAGVPIFRGLGLGISIGYMYLYKGLEGLLFSVVMIIPAAFISTVALLFAARESLKLSTAFLSFMVKQPGKYNMSGTLRLYCVKFLGFLLALAAAAAVDTLFTHLFSSLFV